VAVISEDFARGIAVDPAAALGKRIKVGPFVQDDWREVIGVVQDVRQDGLYAPTPSSVYYPVLTANQFQRPLAATTSVAFTVRSERAGTTSLTEEIRAAVRSVSASIPVAQERTMQEYYGASLARTSFTLVLLGIAGVMALALGVIGIYGVIAYVVAQRTREIGIRAALGAHPRSLTRMFLLQGLTVCGIGAAVGLVAALGVGRAMSSLLFGVGALDPVAYVAALGVMLAAATIATYVPARRAASIDPIETLRAE
jgi:ABC-type antimicrobial peptide transport system permease subunit